MDYRTTDRSVWGSTLTVGKSQLAVEADGYIEDVPPEAAARLDKMPGYKAVPAAKAASSAGTQAAPPAPADETEDAPADPPAPPDSSEGSSEGEEADDAEGAGDPEEDPEEDAEETETEPPVAAQASAGDGNGQAVSDWREVTRAEAEEHGGARSDPTGQRFFLPKEAPKKRTAQ